MQKSPAHGFVSGFLTIAGHEHRDHEGVSGEAGTQVGDLHEHAPIEHVRFTRHIPDGSDNGQSRPAETLLYVDNDGRAYPIDHNALHSIIPSRTPRAIASMFSPTTSGWTGRLSIVSAR